MEGLTLNAGYGAVLKTIQPDKTISVVNGKTMPRLVKSCRGFKKRNNILTLSCSQAITQVTSLRANPWFTTQYTQKDLTFLSYNYVLSMDLFQLDNPSLAIVLLWCALEAENTGHTFN